MLLNYSSLEIAFFPVVIMKTAIPVIRRNTKEPVPIFISRCHCPPSPKAANMDVCKKNKDTKAAARESSLLAE